MTTTKTITKAELANFTGSETWYRHGLVRDVLFTDGAKYVADAICRAPKRAGATVNFRFRRLGTTRKVARSREMNGTFAWLRPWSCAGLH